ncbi:hypothetical protein VP1G_11374 [Cytospora mali]|uniref:Uncharacterized protein n=1 Tax=Cytospora mali TaxID=578113 RepID=A0A194VFB4_CYTMA|nr:hypothetical protein VP1G_11374 [Valsa mali var. pyri (nom. inval.)]
MAGRCLREARGGRCLTSLVPHIPAANPLVTWDRTAAAFLKLLGEGWPAVTHIPPVGQQQVEGIQGWAQRGR